MNYIHDTIAGGYIPKLLGIYERELHGIISGLAALSIRRVVNIGAADGYYAVGLSRLSPELWVVAFEMEARGREFLRILAERNGVTSQIEICGRCEWEDLSGVLDQPQQTLVLCDVEGEEELLMNPGKIPELKKAYLLIEIHEGKNPGVSEKVRNRFVSSHKIETIWQQKREAAEFPFENSYTRKLDPQHLAAAVDEGRPVRPGVTPMNWFWMVPNQAT